MKIFSGFKALTCAVGAVVVGSTGAVVALYPPRHTRRSILTWRAATLHWNNTKLPTLNY